MIVDVVMPKMGESINEGTILEWRKEVGEKINLDDESESSDEEEILLEATNSSSSSDSSSASSFLSTGSSSIPSFTSSTFSIQTLNSSSSDMFVFRGSE